MTKEPLFYFHQKSGEGLTYSAKWFKLDRIKYTLASMTRTVFVDSQTGKRMGDLREDGYYFMRPR